MADATILNDVSEFVHIPGLELVTLTLGDGETYQSRKFKTILFVIVSSNYDTDNHINASFSGQTVTVNWNGQADKTCSLLIAGKK